jgi:hypothetical protein
MQHYAQSDGPHSTGCATSAFEAECSTVDQHHQALPGAVCLLRRRMVDQLYLEATVWDLAASHYRKVASAYHMLLTTKASLQQT